MATTSPFGVQSSPFGGGGAPKAAGGDPTPAAPARTGPRLQTRKLIADALNEGPKDVGDVNSVAEAIEEAIYQIHSDEKSKEYRTKLRTVTLNLKGSKNEKLRRALLEGGVSGSELLELDAKTLQGKVEEYAKAAPKAAPKVAPKPPAMAQEVEPDRPIVPPSAEAPVVPTSPTSADPPPVMPQFGAAPGVGAAVQPPSVDGDVGAPVVGTTVMPPSPGGVSAAAKTQVMPPAPLQIPEAQATPAAAISSPTAFPPSPPGDVPKASFSPKAQGEIPAAAPSPKAADKSPASDGPPAGGPPKGGPPPVGPPGPSSSAPPPGAQSQNPMGGAFKPTAVHLPGRPKPGAATPGKRPVPKPPVPSMGNPFGGPAPAAAATSQDTQEEKVAPQIMGAPFGGPAPEEKAVMGESIPSAPEESKAPNNAVSAPAPGGLVNPHVQGAPVIQPATGSNQVVPPAPMPVHAMGAPVFPPASGSNQVIPPVPMPAQAQGVPVIPPAAGSNQVVPPANRVMPPAVTNQVVQPASYNAAPLNGPASIAAPAPGPITLPKEMEAALAQVEALREARKHAEKTRQKGAPGISLLKASAIPAGDEDVQKALKHADELVSKASFEKQKLQEELDAVKKQLMEQKEESSVLQANLRDSHAQVAALEQQVQQVQLSTTPQNEESQQSAELQGKLKAAQEEILSLQKLNAERALVNSSGADDSAAHLKQEFLEANAERQQLQVEVGRMKESIALLEKQNASFKQERDDLAQRARIQVDSTQHQNLQADLLSTQKELAQSRIALRDSQQALHDTSMAAQKREEECRHMLASEVSALKHAHEEELKALRQNQSSLQAQIAALQQQVDASRTDRRARVRSLLEKSGVVMQEARELSPDPKVVRAQLSTISQNIAPPHVNIAPPPRAQASQQPAFKDANPPPTSPFGVAPPQMKTSPFGAHPSAGNDLTQPAGNSTFGAHESAAGCPDGMFEAAPPAAATSGCPAGMFDEAPGCPDGMFDQAPPPAAQSSQLGVPAGMFDDAPAPAALASSQPALAQPLNPITTSVPEDVPSALQMPVTQPYSPSAMGVPDGMFGAEPKTGDQWFGNSESSSWETEASPSFDIGRLTQNASPPLQAPPEVSAPLAQGDASGWFSQGEPQSAADSAALFQGSNDTSGFFEQAQVDTSAGVCNHQGVFSSSGPSAPSHDTTTLFGAPQSDARDTSNPFGVQNPGDTVSELFGGPSSPSGGAGGTAGLFDDQDGNGLFGASRGHIGGQLNGVFSREGTSGTQFGSMAQPVPPTAAAAPWEAVAPAKSATGGSDVSSLFD